MKDANVKYYQIDNRKFKLERISDTFYRLELIEENDKLVFDFKGNRAKEEALAEIISYSEIDERDYEED